LLALSVEETALRDDRLADDPDQMPRWRRRQGPNHRQGVEADVHAFDAEVEAEGYEREADMRARFAGDFN
jgi:hypothetical protein